MRTPKCTSRLYIYPSNCLAQLSICRPTSPELGVGQTLCKPYPSSWRLQRFASSMQVITVVPGNRVYLHTGSPRSVVTVGSVTAIVVLEAMPCPRGRVQRAVPSCKSWGVVRGNRAYLSRRTKSCSSCRWIVGRYRGFGNDDTSPVKVLS